jgi:hypothetical protein
VVADGQGVASEQREDHTHDARTGEDHLGPVRLQADDRAPLVCVEVAVELDLAIDLRAVEHGALHRVRVIDGELAADGGEVGDRAAHANDRGGYRAPVEPLELGGDCHVQPRECRPRGPLGQPVTLREAHGTDVEAEALRDAVAVSVREL